MAVTPTTPAGAAMTAQKLHDVRTANPFRPFVVRVADGRTFRVLHRDYLSVSPGGRTVIVYGDNDGFSILDSLLITEVTVDPPQPAEAAATDTSA